MKYLLILMVIALNTFVFTSVARASQYSYERWFHPNFHYDLNTISWASDFKNQEVWDEVLPHIDVISLFYDTVRRNPDNFLADFIPIVQSHHVKIAIETYGSWSHTPCDSNRGESAAAFQLVDLKKIYDNGGVITYLALDDPLLKTISGSQWPRTCSFTMEQSLTEMIDFMQAIHAVYPDIKIGLITNFPHWRYGDSLPYTHNTVGNQDYSVVMSTMATMLASRGESLEFLHVDNPYDYAMGAHSAPDMNLVQQTDWMQRILDLENQSRSLGLKFGLIYNSERGGSNGSSDTPYYQDTMDFVRAYRTKGGNPDDVILESWYRRPSALFPTDQSYTMAYIALHAFDLYQTLAPSPSPTCHPSDINSDGVTNISDYSLLVTDFFKTAPANPRSDINTDGVVNVMDYSILASNFFKTTGCL